MKITIPDSPRISLAFAQRSDLSPVTDRLIHDAARHTVRNSSDIVGFISFLRECVFENQNANFLVCYGKNGILFLPIDDDDGVEWESDMEKPSRVLQVIFDPESGWTECRICNFRPEKEMAKRRSAELLCGHDPKTAGENANGMNAQTEQ